MPEFIQLQKNKAMKDLHNGIGALVREISVGSTITKLVLNEDLCYYSYKRLKGQILITKSKENHFMKVKNVHGQAGASCCTGNDLALFRWEELLPEPVA